MIPKKIRRGTSFHTQLYYPYRTFFNFNYDSWSVTGLEVGHDLIGLNLIDVSIYVIFKTNQIQTWTWPCFCWLLDFLGEKKLINPFFTNCLNIAPLCFVCKCTCTVDNTLSPLFHGSLVVTCTIRRLKQEGHCRVTRQKMERAYLSLCTFLMLIWLSVQQERGYSEYFFPSCPFVSDMTGSLTKRSW